MKLNHLLLIILSTSSLPIYAGSYTDKLSECLISKISQPEKIMLAQWVFAAMSYHPSVKAMSNVSSEKAEKLSKRSDQLLVTLLSKRCESEARQAKKHEGAIAFRTSGQVLGQVAMQSLLANPEVNKYISGAKMNEK